VPGRTSQITGPEMDEKMRAVFQRLSAGRDFFDSQEPNLRPALSGRAGKTLFAESAAGQSASLKAPAPPSAHK
jgi:hypothetical protein